MNLAQKGLAVLILLTQLSSSAVAQNQCSSIENDVARLKCYDDQAALQSGTLEARETQEIFEDLYELTRYENDTSGYQSEVFALALDGCKIRNHRYTVSLVQESNALQALVKGGPQKVVYAHYNLSTTEIALNDLSQDKSRLTQNGYSFVFPRSKGGHELSGNTKLEIRGAIPDLSEMGNYLLSPSGLNSTSWIFGVPSTKTHRTGFFQLFHPIHAPDKTEISELFLELVDSCSTG